MSRCGKENHCCWFQGKECDYLTASPHPDFIYACSFRLKYDSWEEVGSDPTYQEKIVPKLKEIGYENCWDYPEKDRVCHTCGEKG